MIPGRCELSLDVRHADDAVRKTAVENLARAVRDIASRRKLEVTWEPRLNQATVAMDAGLTSALARAVEPAGFAPQAHVSGAGHDAMVVASRMPAAMLFLRCDKGHQPSPCRICPRRGRGSGARGRPGISRRAARGVHVADVVVRGGTVVNADGRRLADVAVVEAAHRGGRRGAAGARRARRWTPAAFWFFPA